MNKFWKRNSPQPFHDVTHRAIGDIPGCTMLAPDEDRYTGKFPSQQLCEYINELKEKMKFFDDGVRMRYDKPDRMVPVESSDVQHPITYPPAGFVLVNSQWVRS